MKDTLASVDDTTSFAVLLSKHPWRGHSNRQRRHNKSYRQDQKYALHYIFTSSLLFPFPKAKTGHPRSSST
jgi:hypothetical protein